MKPLSLQNKNYALFLITNQSGVARNYFTINDVELLQQITKDLAVNGIKPFGDKSVTMVQRIIVTIKAKPQMVRELITKYNIDIKKSFMCGDKLSDAECGVNANITGILVRSKEIQNKFKAFSTLIDFANSIV
ncbi:MAG: HAD hydrolase-like protein [Bacteriovoracaceae bacterium]